MQQKQIKEIIEESKSNIRKDILKDNLVMFFTRVIEDLKNDSSKNLFGRAYELYYLINPYKALHSRKQILTFFKNNKAIVLLNFSIFIFRDFSIIFYVP